MGGAGAVVFKARVAEDSAVIRVEAALPVDVAESVAGGRGESEVIVEDAMEEEVVDDVVEVWPAVAAEAAESADATIGSRDCSAIAKAANAAEISVERRIVNE